jgi:hypothetical protein
MESLFFQENISDDQAIPILSRFLPDWSAFNTVTRQLIFCCGLEMFWRWLAWE